MNKPFTEPDPDPRDANRSDPADGLLHPPAGPPWYQEGEEPDYRFTLANERTFLAWIRTALALMAAAVAVVHLLPGLDVPGARRTLGTLLIVAALIISSCAYPRWRSVQRAMRSGGDLPRNWPLPAIAIVITIAGLIALATVFA